MQTIGKYRILAPLEAGTRATFYSAYDSALDRLVTLGIVAGSPDRIDPSALREPPRGIALDHPNLARTLDVFRDEGRLVVVLEPLDGGTLAELIRRRQPSRLEDKLALMVQLCAGLHHAHAHGFVHGDVNPRNVIVLPNDQVKLLELGLDRLADVDPGVGAVSSTPGYQSPEQARGRLDVRSDVFSVGAVCYELVAFRPPFEGDDLEEILDRIRRGEPTPLAQAVVAIPSDLAAIVDRALHGDPGRRFPSLAEMAAALTFVRRRLTDQALVMGGLAECVTRTRERRLAGSPYAVPTGDVADTGGRRRPAPGPAAGSVARLPQAQPRPRNARSRTLVTAAAVLLALALGIEPGPGPAPLPGPASSPSAADREATAGVRMQMLAARDGATKAQAGRLAPRAWASALAEQHDAETALDRQAFARARTLFVNAEGAYHRAWRGAVAVTAVRRERLALLRRAARAAESAADEARWEAERAGAPRYAAPALELAREREREARAARDGRNYELTARRFRDVERAYQRAALEAPEARSKSFGELLLAAFRRLAPAEAPAAPLLAFGERRDARHDLVATDR